ncbi:hypothetical protein EV360DRAFT_87778 [Lentinula raphanica]|nr:hypothetical protein EV360DRAFT_87778 [Lentinula raphanica]
MPSYAELMATLKVEQPSSSSTSAYQKLLAKSKSDTRVTSSSQNSIPPKLPWFDDSRGDSVSQYQTLLAGSSDSSDSDALDYEMRVMAAGLSNGLYNSAKTPSLETAFEKFQTEITKETVRSMMDRAKDADPVEGDSLESLLVPNRNGRMQFGHSTKRNIKTTRALITVSSLKQAALDLQLKLRNLSFSQPPADIQSSLCTIEDEIETIRLQATSISNVEACGEAVEVLNTLDSIKETLRLWRQEYPDTSPVKIDNRKYFVDPGNGKNTPTLIAYCLTLVSRVFERTAQRGATFVLKMIKMFGYSLATLGGRNLNAQQEAALASIPESIERLEKKFNLDIDAVPYAVCPDCSCTYAPSYPNGSSSPTYPSTCSEKKARSAPICGASLLSYGKPIKVFEYYPFFDWFGKFIALPGIEEYGDRFCEAVVRHQVVPTDKVSAADGRFVFEFRGADGRFFVRDRQDEGRWFFILNADFFNVEGNRIRGKSSSTGMLAMTCLNLPLEIRNDHAYIYIPGIIQGPQEPKAQDAEH